MFFLFSRNVGVSMQFLFFLINDSTLGQKLRVLNALISHKSDSCSIRIAAIRYTFILIIFISMLAHIRFFYFNSILSCSTALRRNSRTPTLLIAQDINSH